MRTAIPVKYVGHNLTIMLQLNDALNTVEMVKSLSLNVMMEIIKMVMDVV